MLHLLVIKPVTSSGNRSGRSESLLYVNIAKKGLEWGPDHEYSGYPGSAFNVMKMTVPQNVSYEMNCVITLQ